MKKYLVISLMLAMVLVAVPAFAGGFGGFIVKATSQVGVISTSSGNSGSGATALNTSYAGVKFSGKDVSTLATTTGYTGGYGNNIATQLGSAFASGWKIGF